jgi:hypothetical protein
VFTEDGFNGRTIANVGLHKEVPLPALRSFYVRQIFPVPRIGKRVQVDHLPAELAIVKEKMDKVGTDEAGASGNKNRGELTHQRALPGL